MHQGHNKDYNKGHNKAIVMINRRGNEEPSYYIIISIQCMYEELNIEILIWVMTNRKFSKREWFI